MMSHPWLTPSVVDVLEVVGGAREGVRITEEGGVTAGGGMGDLVVARRLENRLISGDSRDIIHF